jgi:hypothetical protein
MSKSEEVFGKKKGEVFELPYEVAIYIPSTQDVDRVISVDQMNLRVDEVKKYLAKTFGGYTSSETLGGFIASNGELVNEEVIKITSFSTVEDFNKHKVELLKQIGKWGDKWGQEAIGFEYEGDLYYIPKKYGMGGFILGTAIGGYAGYKIGRARSKKTGFETEKKVGRAIKRGAKSTASKLKEKRAKRKASKMEGGGGIDSRMDKLPPVVKALVKELSEMDMDEVNSVTVQEKVDEANMKYAQVYPDAGDLGSYTPIGGATVVTYEEYSQGEDITVNDREGFVVQNEDRVIVIQYYDDDSVEEIKYKDGGAVRLVADKLIHRSDNNHTTTVGIIRETPKTKSLYISPFASASMKKEGEKWAKENGYTLRKSYKGGGKITVENFKYDPSIDYMSEYDKLPIEVTNIINSEKYTNDDEWDNNYEELLSELEKVGWTFEYDMSGGYHSLRPVGEPEQEFKNGGGVKKTITGRERLYEDENVALEHNTVSDKYSVVDPDTGKFMENGGGVAGLHISRLEKDFGKDFISSGKVSKKGNNQFKVEDGILLIKQGSGNWEKWRKISYEGGGGISFSEAEGIKGRNNSTGVSFGTVIGSGKSAEEYTSGGKQINVRDSYGDRRGEKTIIFNDKGLVHEIIDYGYSTDGSYVSTASGSVSSYSPKNKTESVKILSKIYNPSFSKKLHTTMSKAAKSYAGGGEILKGINKLQNDLGVKVTESSYNPDGDGYTIYPNSQPKTDKYYDGRSSQTIDIKYNGQKVYLRAAFGYAISISILSKMLNVDIRPSSYVGYDKIDVSLHPKPISMTMLKKMVKVMKKGLKDSADNFSPYAGGGEIPREWVVKLQHNENDKVEIITLDNTELEDGDEVIKTEKEARYYALKEVQHPNDWSVVGVKNSTSDYAGGGEIRSAVRWAKGDIIENDYQTSQDVNIIERLEDSGSELYKVRQKLGIHDTDEWEDVYDKAFADTENAYGIPSQYEPYVEDSVFGSSYAGGGEITEEDFKEKIRVQADRQGKTYSDEQVDAIYDRVA